MILECFEYNQHFVAMMNIINHAKLFNKEGKFEKHHIIPRCFFKKKGLKIDNSSSNLVNLTIEEHRKVHQLATLCAKEFIKVSLKYADNMMNRRSMLGENHPLYGLKHSEESKKKMSENSKGERNGNYHRKFSKEHREKISQSLKLLHKEGKRDNSGEKNPCYGLHFSWYNDGVRNYRVKENCVPLQNWKRGKI